MKQEPTQELGPDLPAHPISRRRVLQGLVASAVTLEALDVLHPSGLFDFNRVLPLRPGDGPLKRWGTRWNAESVTVARQPDGRGARINFTSSIGPPTPVIDALADRFRTLKFELTYSNEASVAGGWRWAPIDPGRDHGGHRTRCPVDPDWCLHPSPHAGGVWVRMDREERSRQVAPAGPVFTWRFEPKSVGPDPD
jgi:hypothetical protein